MAKADRTIPPGCVVISIADDQGNVDLRNHLCNRPFGRTHGTDPMTNGEVTPMARVRQARRCSAHRSDGKPCRAWAIVGGFVCRAHGGSAPQVRFEARVRALEASILPGFNLAYDRWQREKAEWWARRIAITAELLGIPPGEVQPTDIAWCRGWYGQPEGLDAEPKMRWDRRYGPRLRTRRR